MFAAPNQPSAPPPSTYAAPGAPPAKSEAGEFTRMFESPLRPEPLKQVQGGAPDPYAGLGPAGPTQPAPAGEFTMMFGAKDLPPAKTPPIAPPVVSAPGSGSATNVFETPQFTGGFKVPGAATPSSGPAPSVGQIEYSTLMSKPSEGILAQAAAAQPVEEQKSFFKRNMPLILIGAAFLLLLIIIIVVFALKK
jgi:hypothetical protein